MTGVQKHQKLIELSKALFSKAEEYFPEGHDRGACTFNAADHAWLAFNAVAIERGYEVDRTIYFNDKLTTKKGPVT